MTVLRRTDETVLSCATPGQVGQISAGYFQSGAQDVLGKQNLARVGRAVRVFIRKTRF